MNDMTSVIVPKSDQINADDLIGGDMLITIRDVKITGGQEQPVSIYFEGSDKAFRPCKSMSRVLVAAWGPDAKKYVGRSLQLYRDPTVKWGGMEVGGIRIRAMTDIQRDMTMALTATKGSRKPYTVKPLAIAAQQKSKAGGAAVPKAPAGYDFLNGIEECAGPGALRQWWKDHNEAIPDDIYQAVLEAYDARAATFRPATPTPQPAAGAGSPAEAEPHPTADDAAAPAKPSLQEKMQRVASGEKASHEPEDRAGADMGEKPTLAAAIAEIDAAEFVPDVNTRTAALLPLLGEEDADALRNHAMDRIATLSGKAA